jgi:hypothetical protein
MGDSDGMFTIYPNTSGSPPFHLLAGTQFWLQGHPDKNRPRLAVRLGNFVADVRYAIWRLTGWDWV